MYDTAATQIAKEPCGLQAIHNRIDAAYESAARVAKDLGNFCDRTLGGLPEAGESARPTPVRNGSLGAIEDKLDCLFAALGTAEQFAGRLGSVG